MNFTFAEIDVLIERGYLKKDSQHKFNIDYASVSTNQGFGYYSIQKLENGEIKTFSAEPINVDPDDGSYDTETRIEYFKTFEDFVNRKPYKK